MDFSVTQLHTSENRMKEEISKLLNTTKVSTTSDLSVTVLEKLKKADFISSVLSLVTVCENNIDQCKSAAEKSDELKDSKIIYQKEIIEAQKISISIYHNLSTHKGT